MDEPTLTPENLISSKRSCARSNNHREMHAYITWTTKDLSTDTGESSLLAFTRNDAKALILSASRKCYGANRGGGECVEENSKASETENWNAMDTEEHLARSCRRYRRSGRFSQPRRRPKTVSPQGRLYFRLLQLLALGSLYTQVPIILPTILSFTISK